MKRRYRSGQNYSRGSVIVGDREDAADAVVEGNEGFSADNAGNHLNLVVEEFHEMLVVAGEEFDEHGIGACGEMTFHDLGNLFKFGDDLAVHGSTLEVHADVGACAVAQHFRVDKIAGTGDDVEVNHALDALMDCCTRHTALLCHILGGNAGVAHDDFKNFPV